MSPARKAALWVLLTWHRSGVFPDQLLRDYWAKHPQSRAADRHLSYQLVFGVLRWLKRLDWVIGQVSSRPLEKISPRPLYLLRLGAFQILHLSRIPLSAAVHESVQLAKEGREPWAAGFVNAVLRALIRHQDRLIFPGEEDPLSYLTVRYSFPSWLVQRWIDLWGRKEAENLCRFLNEIPPVTLRVNTLKTGRDALMKILKEEAARPLPTPYAPAGIRVEDPEGPLWDCRAFQDGLFQIQDEASQLISLILDPKPGETVLDLCAGAGGKSSHMAELMKDQGRVVAVDLHPQKLEALQENTRRLGIKIVEPLRGDGLEGHLFSRTAPPFDRILIDAPCTGWGVINRNPDLKWRLRPEDGPRLAERQNKFLQNAAAWLKSGGVMVYATCTLNPEENQEVLRRFLETHPHFEVEGVSPFLPQTAEGLTDGHGCFQTWPPRHRLDGFFAARLRKKGSSLP